MTNKGPAPNNTKIRSKDIKIRILWRLALKVVSAPKFRWHPRYVKT